MESEETLPEDRGSVALEGRQLISRSPRRAIDVDVMPAYEDFSQEEVVRSPDLLTPSSRIPSRVDRRRLI